MSKRMNIATPRKAKDGKTFWTNIGTAWFNDNGCIQLVFDALPIPDGEGRVVANLFEPREKTQSYNGDPTTNRSGGISRQTVDLDDDIPGF
jgi:hypothetical protein